MSATSGIPQNLIACYVNGHYPDGTAHGTGGERHMRVRDKGRGFSSAHPGSVAAEARREDAEQAMIAAGLSERQRQVLQLVAEGLTLSEVGTRLGVSYGTARNIASEAGKRLAEHRAAVKSMETL